MYRGLRGQVEGNCLDNSDRPLRRLHFGRCGLAVLRLCHDNRVAVFCQHSSPRNKMAGHARSCKLDLLRGTCVVGCSTGYELASGDSPRALTCVSENESVAGLTGSLHARQVMRCSTRTNPMSFGVSEDRENIKYGASCQAAGVVRFESANHRDLSCLAIGQLESNSVLPDPVCEEKDCIDGATPDSFMLAPDCMHLTSGDQCNVASTAGYTGSASIFTCTLDGVNGSVSLIGGLKNCSATGSAVDGVPSGHDCHDAR